MAVKQIDKSKLIASNWYVGRGRNGNVGRWNGDSFEVITDSVD